MEIYNFLGMASKVGGLLLCGYGASIGDLESTAGGVGLALCGGLITSDYWSGARNYLKNRELSMAEIRLQKDLGVPMVVRTSSGTHSLDNKVEEDDQNSEGDDSGDKPNSDGPAIA